MAPEIVLHSLNMERDGNFDPIYSNAVDIWALGVTTYLLLLGDFPFQDNSFQRLRDYHSGILEFPSNAMLENGLSTEVCRFTKSLMAPRPEDRPSVADCSAHDWLKRFPNSTTDMPDTSTQSSTDRDTEASGRWSAEFSVTDTASSQQKTTKNQAEPPSQASFASKSVHDSGISMSFESHPVVMEESPSTSLPSIHKIGMMSNFRPDRWHMTTELKYDTGEIKALDSSPDREFLASGGRQNTKDLEHTNMDAGWHVIGTHESYHRRRFLTQRQDSGVSIR